MTRPPFRFRLRLVAPVLLLAGIAVAACNRPDDEPPTVVNDTTLSATPPAPAADTTADPESAPLQAATNEVEAPDFTLQTLDGKPFRLSEQRGKVVVLNFWATWCPPCRREIPDFIRLQRELGDRGLLFVGVSLDDEGEAVVRPFADEMKFNYPILVDQGAVADLYGPIAVMPTTYVVDRRGIVRYYAPGMLTDRTLRPALLDLLDAPTPTS